MGIPGFLIIPEIMGIPGFPIIPEILEVPYGLKVLAQENLEVQGK